jgi:hypothetical protein
MPLKYIITPPRSLLKIKGEYIRRDDLPQDQLPLKNHVISHAYKVIKITNMANKNFKELHLGSFF